MEIIRKDGSSVTIGLIQLSIICGAVTSIISAICYAIGDNKRKGDK